MLTLLSAEWESYTFFMRLLWRLRGETTGVVDGPFYVPSLSRAAGGLIISYL